MTFKLKTHTNVLGCVADPVKGLTSRYRPSKQITEGRFTAVNGHRKRGKGMDRGNRRDGQIKITNYVISNVHIQLM